MIPWYVASFRRDYLDRYSHRDEVEAQADVDAIIRLIAPRLDAPLLDLGCGAGRHLLALHRAGFRRLTGLDLSQGLLDLASERLAAAEAPQIELVRADMRCIPYVEEFATVLSLFTSFGYFERDEENAAVIAAVHRALRRGGTFLIDYLNRDWVIAHLTREEETEVAGQPVRIERSLTADRCRVEKTTRVIEADGKEKVFCESVRMYTPFEMEEILAEAGFVAIRCFGSLQGEPHSSESPRLVLVAKKGERDG